MNHRITNKRIITVIFALALLLVCTASIVSCGGDDSETLFPEYTGDIWTLEPEDSLEAETGHIEVDSNDNVIDIGHFTTPVSENDETGVDADQSEVTPDEATDEANNEMNGTPAATDDPEVTTVHVIDSYDGVHYWPSDEFDHSGYKPLNPVTTAVN